jgi:hypothetical protein
MLTQIILDFDTPEPLACDSLYAYAGAKDLSGVTSLAAVADTRDGSLSYLADILPNLTKLRLNNSRISSIRDIGCRLSSLRILSLANCGLTSLNGVSTLSRNLEELHLAFNAIADVSDLMGMDRLRVLDLEGGQISNLQNLRFLTRCTALTALTLARNPAARDFEDYARAVSELVPNLVYLDERRIRGRTGAGDPENAVPVAPPAEGAGEPRARRRTTKRTGENEESVVSELIAEKAEARPPSARGMSIRAKIREARAGNQIGERPAAKIIRPRSARNGAGRA